MILSVQDILFLQNRVAYTRDEQAYQKIFFHFHPSLYRFANNMVANGSIADEIVADAMMKIWEMGSRLAQVDKLNLYLFTAVKNAALTHLSKIKSQYISLDEAVENKVFDKADNPENQLILTEVQQHIEAAITTLAPQCQLVYRLIKEEGFSYKEVCSILQVSQNTIETHMRIALKKIRLSLNAYLMEKK